MDAPHVVDPRSLGEPLLVSHPGAGVHEPLFQWSHHHSDPMTLIVGRERHDLTDPNRPHHRPNWFLLIPRSNS
jgi:hypothetical protein